MSAHKSILIVDDDKFVSQIIRNALERKGYKAVIAKDGQEGLNVIRTEAPDLVLCDRCMPKLSGYGLLKTIRNEYPEYNNIPFIFLTSLGDPRDKMATADLQPTSYLTKPINFDELLSVVEEQLGAVPVEQKKAQGE